MKKKKNNIINFPSSISKLERKVEAILFAASEPLEIDTIEKRLKTTTNENMTFPYELVEPRDSARRGPDLKKEKRVLRIIDF